MNIQNLKSQAEDALNRAAYAPRKVVAIHTGATLALSLLLTLVSYLLNQRTGTGGIGDLGAQAALSTAQVVLQLASTVVVPFWSAGLVFWSLRCLRGQDADLRTLPEGFRKWKSILSSSVMMALRYLIAGFASAYLSSMLVLLTPAATPLMNASQALTQSTTADVFSLLGDSLPMVMGWYGGIFLLIFGLLAVPLFYRWRMVSYIIMDSDKVGGMQAMLLSRVMTQRRKMELFKIDLRFWWFYLLEALAAVLSWGDILLSLAGVSLPLSGQAATWCLALLSMICQMALYVWAKPKLALTYAAAYETLRQLPPAQPKQTQPKPHPWGNF